MLIAQSALRHPIDSYSILLGEICVLFKGLKCKLYLSFIRRVNNRLLLRHQYREGILVGAWQKQLTCLQGTLVYIPKLELILEVFKVLKLYQIQSKSILVLLGLRYKYQLQNSRVSFVQTKSNIIAQSNKGLSNTQYSLL